MSNVNDNSNDDVVLIDVYNIIYRAYHGNKNLLTNEKGIPTNALYTTIKMLEKIPDMFSNMRFCLAVFDGGSNNFRKELDPNYKIHRKPMPEELVVQMPYIKEAFRILGWPMLFAKNEEADDIIGTLAKRSGNAGFNTYIISGDKDFRQLVNGRINVIDTMHDICYDEDKVKEKMGVEPKLVVSYLALLGDSSDNVMGVDGVGDKTAAKLLNEYGSMDGIRQNQDKIKGKVGENIRKAFENGQIEKSMQLITLKTDVELHLKNKDMKKQPRNDIEWVEFCKEMNFKSFLNKMPKM